MKKRRTSKRTLQTDVPCNVRDKAAVSSFWKDDTAHTGTRATRQASRQAKSLIRGPTYRVNAPASSQVAWMRSGNSAYIRRHHFFP